MKTIKTTARTLFYLSGGALLAAAGATVWPPHPVSADEMHAVPPPAIDGLASTAAAGGASRSATAVLAGGCFWGVQGVFQHVKGVTSAVSGYAGGSSETASYPVVSSGETGHAETVKITYDPTQVSYGKLLQIYFSVVTNPTELNRQGPDEGTQYRSDIFATTPDQARIAKTYIAQLQKAHVFDALIVTKVSDYKAFYPAESYHQNYLTLHPNQPYIAENDIPKVEGLKKLFPQDYQPSPVLAATN